MNKKELIDAVSKGSGLNKKQSGAALDELVGAVVKAVGSGEDVTLIGFGTFKSVSRKARKGRNPQTGKEIKIPAKKQPKFVPGKGFKDAVK
jgi:DNA-binding protein HU-beta